MGMFSWIDPKTGENIVADYNGQTAYVPVPKEFGGYCLVEENYEGYGVFQGMDVYELVAEWNRYNMPLETEAMKQPRREDYTSDEDFNYAIERYAGDFLMLRDWASCEHSDEDMAERYGKEFKRNIGILIACYDADNSKLRYPIKVSTSKCKYEDADWSPSDPEQGFYPNWENSGGDYDWYDDDDEGEGEDW